jgi:hypothetical protein
MRHHQRIANPPWLKRDNPLEGNISNHPSVAHFTIEISLHRNIIVTSSTGSLLRLDQSSIYSFILIITWNHGWGQTNNAVPGTTVSCCSRSMIPVPAAGRKRREYKLLHGDFDTRSDRDGEASTVRLSQDFCFQFT